MTDDTWYFAYGSNLWIDQKLRTGDIRTGDERPRIAVLIDYRLAFNKRGVKGNVYANITPCTGDKVMGAVYRWDDQSRDKMGSQFEIGYEEKFVEVSVKGVGKLSVLTFVAKPESVCKEARPTDEYLGKIIAGAKEHGLPAAYVRRIKSIAIGEASNAPSRKQRVFRFIVEPTPKANRT